MQKRFVIIDGSSLLYRAFYALPLLTTAAGEYTNAIYGFTTMLTKLIGELKPDFLLIAFDKGKKTFRNDIFSEYKGTRQKTPMELSAQIPALHELAEAMGICLLEADGFEADDIIGTVSAKAAAEDFEVIVVTGDKDALQLIDSNVCVHLTKKGISEMQCMDEQAFLDQYGFAPEKLIDLKGLMGDTSDNIPGVPGVGEKTASKLLLEYGSLENVLENIEQISGKKLKERLTEFGEQAVLSKKLATIVRDMPLDFNMDTYVMQPDRKKMEDFCQKHEFRNILKKIADLFCQDEAAADIAVEVLPAFAFSVISSKAEGTALYKKIDAEKKWYIFPQYQGQTPEFSIVAAGIALEKDAYFVQADSDAWLVLEKLLGRQDIEKITHDSKFLYHIEKTTGTGVFDTMLAAYLLSPAAAAAAYQLDALADQYLEQVKPAAFNCEEEQLAWSAACVRQLAPVLQAEMKKQGMLDLYEKIELPLLSVLASLEDRGIYVNKEHLEAMAEEVSGHISKLLIEIYALAGTEFNVNSPKQLGEVLFERLQLPAQKKTKTGYSTNAEVLEELRYQHPVVEKVLEYRLWTKLKSTYLDGLRVLIHPASGRIHSTFNQMVTATGRLSSSEPNLQNIPVRTEEGKKIRELFEPGEGYDYLLSADYSQIELRVLAHMSQDKNFLEAFNHNQDIHARTASEVFNVPMKEMTAELRSKAKAVNFGIVYGISDYGLSRDLRISRKEAGQYIESYFEKCPGIKNFIDTVVEKAHADGFVTTMFGRKRYLPAINSSNYNQRTLAERMAMNTPIQGTAADIIKLAMLAAEQKLQQQNLKSRMLLQVHDELVLEVIEEEIPAVSEILRDAMQNAASLSVPLTIDIKWGKNWALAK